MQRLCHITAVNQLPASAATAAPGYFSRGDPANGVPSSVITADVMNGITEELIGVIAGAGLTPDIDDNTQLLQSVLTLGSRQNRCLNSQMWANSYGATAISAGTSGTHYGPAECWRVRSVGTTYASSLQSFTIGQTVVPANPLRYLRVTTTSVAGASNFCALTHPMENVWLFSGQTLTVLFWAKASVNATPITVSLRQVFGAGGSADVDGIGATKITLSDSWAEYQVTIPVTSVAGKSVVADLVDTYTDLQFVLDAGADLNIYTQSLGQRSMTFDVTNVTVTHGDKAISPDSTAAWDDAWKRSRYVQSGAFEKTSLDGSGCWTTQTVAASARQYFPSVRFFCRMRQTPTITLIAPGSGSATARNNTRGTDMGVPLIESAGREGFLASALAANGSAAGDLVGFHWLADARLY